MCLCCMQLLRDTRAVLLNGFLFDELPAQVVLTAAATARAAGAAVFFDPGPRAWTLPPTVLQGVLDLSDVVITTQACRPPPPCLLHLCPRPCMVSVHHMHSP